MKVMVTGAAGFIGTNLQLRIREAGRHVAVPVDVETKPEELAELVSEADAVIHLAGINRHPDASEFSAGNADFTATVCEHLLRTGRKVPVIFSSSVKAGEVGPYGETKLLAEHHLERYAAQSGAPVAICRLVNVFGKWSQPNYNSGAATFCHNIARGLPIKVNDPSSPLTLIHVDDVITQMLAWIDEPGEGLQRPEFGPVYETTVGELAETIRRYHDIPETLLIPETGTGFSRALYSTYVSFLPPEKFAYPLVLKEDARGVFVEAIKTEHCGQFSYFTAHPGVTRGGHYHHIKTEKFLVLTGKAHFRFRHMITGETKVLETEGGTPIVVDTIPGWAHDVTNIGDQELVVLCWANELFDPAAADTVPRGPTE